MNSLWRRKLPTGEALVKEAERLGISQHETWKGGAEGHTTLDEPELQRRLLAVRMSRQTAILNYAQTAGIIASLMLTLAIAVWNGHRQSSQVAADLMLRFDDKLYSGGSGKVANALDMDGNLDHAVGVDDEEIDQFLNNFELLAAVYDKHLIDRDRDMAEDAFSFELEKALGDARVKRYLAESRHEEADLYDGVRDLASEWEINTNAFDPVPEKRAAPKAAPSH